MMLPSSPQLAPRPAGRVAQRDGLAAIDSRFLQLSLREEPDPLPVRGEERSVRSLGA